MSEKLGAVAFRRDADHVFLGREMAQTRDFSEQAVQLIDDEAHRNVGELAEKASRLLDQLRKHLDSIAEELLEKESPAADEIPQLVERQVVPADD